LTTADESQPTDGDALELVTFDLGGRTYALESRYAREVHPLRDVTPIPCTPPLFLGVINLRGQLCPVVDLRLLLGQSRHGMANASRALVIRDARMEVALAIDAVLGMRQVARRTLVPAAGDAEFLVGVAGDVAVLDAESLLRHPAMVVSETVE
jgi:purine-binding chemotaxis protein CheW